LKDTTPTKTKQNRNKKELHKDPEIQGMLCDKKES